MLPKYREMKRFTMERLTDEVMNTCLEREDLIHVSVQTAREACYMYMSHAAVWDEELEAFKAEAVSDMEPGVSVLDVIASLSAAIERELMMLDVEEYRKGISVSEVQDAMAELGIKADPEQMATILAAYEVGHGEGLDECRELMDEAGISDDTVRTLEKRLTD